MKKLLIAVAAVMIAASSYGQGAVAFRNRVGGVFDAPIYITGTTTGAGTIPGLQAQLFLADGTALTPATTFAGATGAAAAYLSGKDVTVPGNTGTPVSLILRVFSGDNWETAKVSGTYGESSPFEVTPTLAPNAPANLTGLGNNQIFVTTIPEPSTIALGILGLGALLLRRRK